MPEKKYLSTLDIENIQKVIDRKCEFIRKKIVHEKNDTSVIRKCMKSCELKFQILADMKNKLKTTGNAYFVYYEFPENVSNEDLDDLCNFIDYDIYAVRYVYKTMAKVYNVSSKKDFDDMYSDVEKRKSLENESLDDCDILLIGLLIENTF